MENLKIKVNNEAESKEAQGLFIKLGYKPEYFDNYEYPQYLAGYQASSTFTNYSDNAFFLAKRKDITLHELRDKVVLKRNDVSDATHIRYDGKKYFHAKSTDYFYHFSNDSEWLLSFWMNDQLLPQLKPIQESKMATPQHKEYLDPHNNYELIEWDGGFMVQEHWIEVPEGAEVLADTWLGLIFYKKKDHKSFNFYDAKGFCGWSSTPTNPYDKSDAFVRAVVWQRDTQPEELPFIDDEPKDSVNNPPHYTGGSIECIEAIEASMSPEAFKGFLKGNILKYTWRYEQKGGVESLKKAQWYNNLLISRV